MRKKTLSYHHDDLTLPRVEATEGGAVLLLPPDALIGSVVTVALLMGFIAVYVAVSIPLYFRLGEPPLVPYVVDTMRPISMILGMATLATLLLLHDLYLRRRGQLKSIRFEIRREYKPTRIWVCRSWAHLDLRSRWMVRISFAGLRKPAERTISRNRQRAEEIASQLRSILGLSTDG